MSEQLDNLARDLVLPRPKTTPWVAIAGAKGGVGKTTIAVNLAILMAKAGYRTLLADLDPGCGDVGVHMRLAANKDLDDAATGDCSVRDALVAGPSGISVLLGKHGSTQFAAGQSMDSILRDITEVAADFDVVIADTGAGIGPSSIAVAERADVVLAVTTPDAPAITDTYALAKVLHRRGHAMPHLVVNRVRSLDEALRAAGKLAAVTGKFLGTTTKMCAHVGHDGMLEHSVAEQRPLAMFGKGSAVDDLRGLCANLLAAIPHTQRRSDAQTVTRRLRPALH